MLGEMRGFTEGNAEQWRWFVPHDLEGLIDLFGSPENYAAVRVCSERRKGGAIFAVVLMHPQYSRN